MSGSEISAKAESLEYSGYQGGIERWLNNVIEPYEQADGPPPPIPARNPRRLEIKTTQDYIDSLPDYMDELEVSA